MTVARCVAPHVAISVAFLTPRGENSKITFIYQKKVFVLPHSRTPGKLTERPRDRVGDLGNAVKT